MNLMKDNLPFCAHLSSKKKLLCSVIKLDKLESSNSTARGY